MNYGLTRSFTSSDEHVEMHTNRAAERDAAREQEVTDRVLQKLRSSRQ